jgi:1,4-dihydroxy-2-naphthoyl-CoA synthase
LDSAVAEYCHDLIEKMPEIVRATRVQLNYWKSQSWAGTVQMAREWLTVHAASAEVAEGLVSFHEKRPPDYEKLRTDIEEAGR